MIAYLEFTMAIILITVTLTLRCYGRKRILFMIAYLEFTMAIILITVTL